LTKTLPHSSVERVYVHGLFPAFHG
jgi:hypothetical protein